MQQARGGSCAGRWAVAATAQTKAAAALAEIHAQLKKAAAEAVARAMKEAEQAQSLLAAQKSLAS